MKLLFIGDIVGRPGREIVKEFLPKVKKEFEIDYVIANYENSAHGYGITKKIFAELKEAGIDIFTGGNHSFDKKEDAKFLLENGYILRPLNYYDAPGSWYFEDENIVVISAMGIFGMPFGKNPFVELKELDFGDKFIFIDFHAEATAEKRALFYMLKGRVGAIVGTHTHIGSDDLTIEDGTCYLTDIGLSGCYDSIIGMEIEGILAHYLSGVKHKFEIPKKCKRVFQALLVEFEGKFAKNAKKIKAFEEIEITQKV
jgi:metallophosphoesterase (TIGR00282 family)